MSAGLLMRALLTIQASDPGFKPEGVLTLQTPLPIPMYGKLATREAFYTRVADRRACAARRDQRRRSSATCRWAGCAAASGRCRSTGEPVNRADNQNAFLRYVTPGYFATLGIPLKRGRDISESDTPRSPVRRRRQRVVRQALLAERESRIGARPPLQLRAQRPRRRRRRRRRAACAGSSAQAEPQVYLSYKQVADDCHHRLHPARLRWCARRRRRRRWRRRSARSSSGSIRRCRSPRSAR